MLFSVVAYTDEGQEVYHLAAPSRELCDRWVAAIDAAVSAARPSRFHGFTSDRTMLFASYRSAFWKPAEVVAARAQQNLGVLTELQVESVEGIPWQPDASVTACPCCGSKLSKHGITGRRKHHCRACGAVVCASCTNTRRKLAKRGSRDPIALRVCANCERGLTRLANREKRHAEIEAAQDLPIVDLSADIVFSRGHLVEALDNAEWLLGLTDEPAPAAKLADFEEALGEMQFLLKQIRVVFPRRLKALVLRSETEVVVAKNLVKLIHGLFDSFMPRLRLRQRMLQHKVNTLSAIARAMEERITSESGNPFDDSSGDDAEVAAVSDAVAEAHVGDEPGVSDAGRVGVCVRAEEEAPRFAEAASGGAGGAMSSALDEDAADIAAAESGALGVSHRKTREHDASQYHEETPAADGAAAAESVSDEAVARLEALEAQLELEFESLTEEELAEQNRRETNISTLSTALIVTQRLAFEHLNAERTVRAAAALVSVVADAHVVVCSLSQTPGYEFRPYVKMFRDGACSAP